ncbi:hypothetical protein [Actinoallomurus sp. CA-150999]|uniref:hypothetical protein n=1 Tax=Actinoallomurus sp. CA-150999 TaxID=3239887 RepID=UPI003D925BDD
MLPPRFVRRVVLAPLLFAVTIAAVAASPLLLLIGAVASRGRHRFLRIAVISEPLRAQWWRVPREAIPEDDRERWLFDWWQTIDAWIAENRPQPTAT